MHNMICKWGMQMLWNRSSIKDVFCFADIKFNISNFDVNYSNQALRINVKQLTISLLDFVLTFQWKSIKIQSLG